MKFGGLVVLWLLLSSTVQAAVYNASGDTTGAAIWTRPVEDLSSLSLIGTDVSYEVLAFQVDAAGAYNFEATAAYDNFTVLYQNGFSATDPLVNAIVANDDNGGIGVSGFTFNLLAGVDYFFVHTGFENTDAGAYQLTISGAGNVVTGSPVPAPAAIWLFAAGLPLVAAVARRRRQA